MTRLWSRVWSVATATVACNGTGRGSSRRVIAVGAVKTRGMRYRVSSGDHAEEEEEDNNHDSITRTGDCSLHEDGGGDATETIGARCDLRRGEPVNLARVIEEKIRRRESFCSYELFPTKATGVYQRFFNETQQCSPTFYALTWHEEMAAGVKSGERFPSLLSAESFPRNTLLHCTAKGLKRSDVEKILSRALELGIVNIFALQGDSVSENGDFTHASDLVTFIRERFGQKFCICVAGYPEMHPQSASKDLDLLYLKFKVDAGADFILTQFFFESRLYIDFVKACRERGITVPIIPGIFPFTNARLLNRMTGICHSNIPPWIQESLKQLGDDDAAVKRLGIDLSVKIIKEIRESGACYGYHLYTLNRSQSAVEVHRQLNEKNEIQEIVNSC